MNIDWSHVTGWFNEEYGVEEGTKKFNEYLEFVKLIHRKEEEYWTKQGEMEE